MLKKVQFWPQAQNVEKETSSGQSSNPKDKSINRKMAPPEE